MSPYSAVPISFFWSIAIFLKLFRKIRNRLAKSKWFSKVLLKAFMKYLNDFMCGIRRSLTPASCFDKRKKNILIVCIVNLNIFIIYKIYMAEEKLWLMPCYPLCEAPLVLTACVGHKRSLRTSFHLSYMWEKGSNNVICIGYMLYVIKHYVASEQHKFYKFFHYFILPKLFLPEWFPNVDSRFASKGNQTFFV